MHSKSFNTLKLSTCTEVASIHWSDVHVLKKLQYSEINYNFLKKFSIQLSEVHVLRKLQYIEVRNMFSRSLNTVKLITWTEEASIQWSEIHVLKNLQYSVVEYM